ncbi:MAG: TonB-dependent receptor plug domain-containing protein [Alistipes sp.]|nr:TonB-dependent receptor plug domain-containing protein [Alistipes sp.]
MYGLMIYSLKTGVCLAVFYLFFKLLLSRETLHRFNRIVVLGVMTLSFVLPLCVVTVVREVPALPLLPLAEPEYFVGELPEQPVSFPWERLAAGVFLLGAVATLGWTLRSIAGVLGVVRRGRRERLDDGAVLVRLDEPIAPCSWGRYILISERDYAESGREIVAHERAHLRLRHSWDLLATDIAGCLQWFNPAMWLLRRELRAIHEYEADEAVLDSGVDARHYQMMLIKKAAGRRWCSVANSFNHSKLKNRITMMLQKKSSRWAGAKALFAVPLAALAVGAFAETVYVLPEDKVTKENVPIRIFGADFSAEEGKKPLVIVNGREVGYDDLKQIAPSQIASMEVLKDQATRERYGEKAENGVVVVKLRAEGDEDATTASRASVVISGDTKADGKPLVVVNGQEVDYETLGTFTSSQIASMEILKGQSAEMQYGQKGENGVIVVKLHPEGAKASTTKVTMTGGSGADATVYFVDGREVSYEELAALDPMTIRGMEIRKDVEPGCVVITTKRGRGADADGERVRRYFSSEEWKEAQRRIAEAAKAGTEEAQRYFSSDEWKEAQRRIAEAAKAGTEEAQRYFSSDEWKEAQRRLSEAWNLSDSLQGRLNGRVSRVTVVRSGSDLNQLFGTDRVCVSGGMEIDPACINAKTIYLINGKRATKEEVAAILPTGKVRRMKTYRGDEAVKRYGEEARSGLVEIRAKK